MSNAALIAFTWSAFALHLLVGVVAQRRWTGFPLLPVVNLAVALCVIAYWAPKWYNLLNKGLDWYASDLWMPLYAVLVTLIATLTLTGRYGGTAPHWIVFAIDTLVLLAAALFFSMFRMDRLI